MKKSSIQNPKQLLFCIKTIILSVHIDKNQVNSPPPEKGTRGMKALSPFQVGHLLLQKRTRRLPP